jgi:hypothetical protein
MIEGYKNIGSNLVKKFINLTLLTETCVNVEQYGGHSVVLVPLMAVVRKCQTDTDSTGSNGYGQPQAVAERCDVAIPWHVGVVGYTYNHAGAGRKTYSCDSICLTTLLSFMLRCNDYIWKKIILHIRRKKYILCMYVWKQEFGSMNYRFYVLTYCNFVRCFNCFGNTCNSGSLYIAAARFSEMLIA